MGVLVPSPFLDERPSELSAFANLPVVAGEEGSVGEAAPLALAWAVEMGAGVVMMVCVCVKE